jgi:hypothetical protein
MDGWMYGCMDGFLYYSQPYFIIRMDGGSLNFCSLQEGSGHPAFAEQPYSHFLIGIPSDPDTTKHTKFNDKALVNYSEIFIEKNTGKKRKE